MSMAPKDGNIIKDGIAALLRGLVGSPGDTGGSTTAGTMMAKENAILEQVNGIKEDTQKSNRKLIRQTETKRFDPAGKSGTTVLEFDFPQPVQFVAIQNKINGALKYGNRTVIYLINGEDSIKTNSYTPSRYGTQFLCAGYLNDLQNTNDIFSFRYIQSDVDYSADPFPYRVYITKLRMEIANIIVEIGNSIDFSVYYIE